jgi:DeoR family fructose operon transcriptional repressor
MDAPGIETLVIGGHLEPRRRAMLGPVAVEGLKSIRVDRLFLAVNGVDPVGGLTAADFEAVQVKRAMLNCAASIIVVADGSKIGRVAFVHIAPLHTASLLLTDAPLPEDMESALRDAGLPEIRY